MSLAEHYLQSTEDHYPLFTKGKLHIYSLAAQINVAWSLAQLGPIYDNTQPCQDRVTSCSQTWSDAALTYTALVLSTFPQLQAPAPSPSGLSQLLACLSQGFLVTLKLWNQDNDLPQLQMKLDWCKGFSDLSSRHHAAETGRRQPGSQVSKCPLSPHLLRKLKS